MDTPAPPDPSEPPADHADALLTALTTDHFVLQSAASTTVTESVGRSSLYVAALSTSLVAIGLVADKPGLMTPFLAIVLPTVFVLGIFTVVRLVDTSVQNVLTLAQIARIRNYYATLSSSAPRFFPVPEAASETDEALATMGLRAAPALGLFTLASMVATVNAVVGGAGAGLLLYAANSTQSAPAASSPQMDSRVIGWISGSGLAITPSSRRLAAPAASPAAAPAGGLPPPRPRGPRPRPRSGRARSAAVPPRRRRC
jgi:hypothetical protein